MSKYPKESVKISLVDSESQNKRQTRSQTRQLISALENLDMKHADKLIFGKGIDPSIIDPKLLTSSLRHAVKTQNICLVRELLKYKPQLKTIDEEPLLKLAIEQSNVDLAMTLINAGVDVKEIDYLHTVVLCEDSKLQKLVVPLIEQGANPEARDSRNKSVLFCAVERQALNIVEELVRRGVRIHEQEYGSILEVLSMSSKAAELLVLFLEYNCISVQMKDRLSLKAIFNFIEGESDDATAVKTLWDLGVSVDQTDREGIAPLHYAASKGKLKKVELLLAHGADVNKKTNRGTTPIMLAVSLHEPAIAALLIQQGANIHDCDIFGRYPIHIACSSESTRNIQLLIDLGANVNVLDQLDFTPFSLLHNSLTEQMRIFLKHFAILAINGSSINGTDLATIKNDQHIFQMYNECLQELQRMKETEFTNNVTYYDLISGEIDKLSILAKNAEFVDQFRKDQRNMKGQKFCWLNYSKELDIALQMAEKRRDLLISKETILQNTFNADLPQIVLDKIARYLLSEDFNNFKKNFYLSLVSNGNGK